MKRVLTALLLTVAAVTPLAAQPTCSGTAPRVTGNLNSSHDYTLTWDAFPGRTFYSVEEMRTDGQDTVTTNVFSPSEPTFTVRHESIHDVTFKYRIRVISQTTHCFIPFYTLTDNRTNDPFLYVQGAAERDTSVEEYVK